MSKSEIDEAIKKYHKGMIKTDELMEIIKKSNPETWNPKTERNPLYPQGDNRSREHNFTFHPLQHKKGKFFQSIIKKAVMKAIDFAHSGMVQQYDSQIFKYDDPRLQALEKFIKEYITINFADYSVKIETQNKIVDISLGLAKEDPYYRSRLLDGINNFIEQFPHGFELTDTEKGNIEIVQTREYYCQKCKCVHKAVPQHALMRNGEYIRDEKGNLLLKCSI